MTANDERLLILRDNHSSDSDRNRGIVGKRAQTPRAAVDFSFADENNGRGTKITRVYDSGIAWAVLLTLRGFFI
jgi:hypothetical protein